MKEGTFKYSFKVGKEIRKDAAIVIGQALELNHEYAGPPTFAYTAGGWVIDRDGMVMTPAKKLDDIHLFQEVFNAIKEAGISPEGRAVVTLSIAGHSGISLRNLVNMAYSKEDLIRRAFGFDCKIVSEDFIEAINNVRLNAKVKGFEEVAKIHDTGNICFDGESISFKFYNPSLDVDEISSQVLFSHKLNEQAKAQKNSMVKKKPIENEKYAMRCWLLRMGFIGSKYRVERKRILENLTGNSAFRSTDNLKEAVSG